MLEETHIQMLSELSYPRRIWYTASTGNRTKGAGWLAGVNRCKLVDVNFNVKNRPYIVCTFRRDPFKFPSNEHKTSFAAHHEYLFRYTQFREMCLAFGHDLKERPPDMDAQRYIWFVTKRFETFIGQEIKAVVSIFKDYIRDDYGEVQQRNVYYDKAVDDYTYGMKLLSYHPVDEIVHPDIDMLYNMLKK